MHVQIKTSRIVVLVLTLLIFVLLGSWRWIEMKAQPFSLFDWWGDAIWGLSTDLGRVAFGEIMVGMLYLILWTLGYVLISATLGWIIAAIVAVMRASKMIMTKPNNRGQGTLRAPAA